MRARADGTVKSDLGQSVKELRQSLRLSQSDLAERSETSQRFVSALERGAANPTLATILKIASALQVEVTELLKPK